MHYSTSYSIFSKLPFPSSPYTGLYTYRKRIFISYTSNYCNRREVIRFADCSRMSMKPRGILKRPSKISCIMYSDENMSGAECWQ